MTRGRDQGSGRTPLGLQGPWAQVEVAQHPFDSGLEIDVDSFDDCGRLGWNLKMRLDPLESRLEKISMKSENVPNGVRMKKLRPFKLSTVAAVRI